MVSRAPANVPARPRLHETSYALATRKTHDQQDQRITRPTGVPLHHVPYVANAVNTNRAIKRATETSNAAFQTGIDFLTISEGSSRNL